jgi:folate-binding protein YgfZ
VTEAAAAGVLAREYEAAREGAALIEVPPRGLLAVTGPQRVKFLHNIVSNDLQSRAPGQGTLLAIMDVKGRLLVLARALVTADAVLLEMPEDRLGRIETLLVHYRVAAPVRFARPAAAMIGVLGPDGFSALRRAGAELPEGMKPEDHVTGAIGGVDVRIVRASDLPRGGWLVHMAPEGSAVVRDALLAAGALAVAGETLDVLRIEDGRPWYGTDIREENLLHETGLVAEYHSPGKGCYVGQEVVARLEARGANVNKVLRGLRLDKPTGGGTVLRAEDREVGVVTTAGVSPRLGPVAMAFVHRSRAEPGSTVDAGDARATVAALPLAP